MAQFGTLPNTELADITGAFGVGAINMMTLFLVLDATTNAFSVIEENAATASWSIFVALPVFVASYVLGVLMNTFGSVLRSSLGWRTPIAILPALRSHPDLRDHLEYEYRQFSKKRDVLEGMVPTACLAAFAIWLEAQTWGYYALGTALAAFALFGAVACLFLVKVIERGFSDLLTELEEPAA